jgi:hypothetical protein
LRSQLCLERQVRPKKYFGRRFGDNVSSTGSRQSTVETAKDAQEHKMYMKIARVFQDSYLGEAYEHYQHLSSIL